MIHQEFWLDSTLRGTSCSSMDVSKAAKALFDAPTLPTVSLHQLGMHFITQCRRVLLPNPKASHPLVCRHSAHNRSTACYSISPSIALGPYLHNVPHRYCLSPPSRPRRRSMDGRQGESPFLCGHVVTLELQQLLDLPLCRAIDTRLKYEQRPRYYADDKGRGRCIHGLFRKLRGMVCEVAVG